MRKLTVKNFSVIKYAELEFGKITVLIGPQSSGKSLLCKLAYFLGKEIVELAVTSLLAGSPWELYLQSSAKALSSRFYLDGGVSPNTEVNFSSFRYFVAVNWPSDPKAPIFRFSDEFKQQYELLLSRQTLAAPSVSGAFIPGGISSNIRQEDIWVGLNSVLADPSAKGVLDGVLYIPAARVLFTDTSKGFAALNNPGIDSITREFSGQIQWDTRWKVGMLTTGRGVTDEINRAMSDIAEGFVMMDGGVPRFIASDGRKLPLESLSTGIQELLPLFNVLEQLMYFREHNVVSFHATYDLVSEKPAGSRPFLYLEEPEASIFPTAQYDLVRLFAWLANDPILNFSWAITTHSPYVLTAFNTLIKAAQAAKAHPESVAAIERVIPKPYWVQEGILRAYAFDGKDCILKSIIDPDTNLIDGDVMDNISDVIGGDFERLLDIQYADA